MHSGTWPAAYAPRAAALRSLVHEVPAREEMQGVLPIYCQSGSVMASRQNFATSALGMEPASPSMTLMTPVGGSTFSPPGRTIVYSRSAPGPCKKRASWLFLSSKIPRMTVPMSTRKKKGACFSESPVPMLVTTAIRLTPLAFIASMTFLVPSVSIVVPTSFVLPPRATTTPTMSSAIIARFTSAMTVTEPWIISRLPFFRALPPSAPPLPAGTTSLEGVRAKPTTL
mmetsp:Transcript_108409/g.187263  ORF Transcript_108409/g.187263 Transcript_108409/m.187263 type:complete len:227 (-) Transcript_108409:355-1035(-)